ncbi:MAG: hypothetical protein ACTIJA_06850, partial [Bavariicoccus seileri]|uniref:hypothetical protein n=1 Tax=Bavariicoccus seileri TaxID=549685 RepID=UPI003F9602C5
FMSLYVALEPLFTIIQFISVNNQQTITFSFTEKKGKKGLNKPFLSLFAFDKSDTLLDLISVCRYIQITKQPNV